MGEDRIRRKIVCRIHEVCFGGGGLARAADAALGVSYNAVLQVEESGGHQWAEGQDDRSSIATGVGNETRRGDLCAMQLRHAIDSFSLCGCGCCRALVFKSIDGAICRFCEPPGAAEVDHTNSAGKRFRNPLARLLVRRGKKQDFNATAGEKFPGEWFLL